ncbi:PfkB and/or Phos pyr kin domain containing protein [Asbolus verrucosus]|uniref:Pyridoxal kinase n=1 Tax=Asbolus verrucosus TaxID=1661398 RepID=A0A482VXK9_ASBVE|nr:PfkB and/or Phos pyr kin domain containing protein [Asbolus verrucosus]
MAETPRVLSIQSHVVSGYVGNKSATFPLQLLGFEVDIINSVQFSNSLGYKTCLGQKLTVKELEDLIDGLKENELDNYTHLLTGYIGSESFLNKISSLVKHLRSVNPNLIYATVITPNQFELELLTGIKIDSIDAAWKAVDLLHRRGCQTVVVSSAEFENEHLLSLASGRTGNTTSKMLTKIPKLPATFGGTGDLFAALFLAWMHKTSNQLKESLEKTVSTLQAVLKRTLQCAEREKSNKIMELKLIQSKIDIEKPKIVVSAENVY